MIFRTPWFTPANNRAEDLKHERSRQIAIYSFVCVELAIRISRQRFRANVQPAQFSESTNFPGRLRWQHKKRVLWWYTGALVKDSAGNRYILGNNHILADANAGKAGDAIVQPSLADVGCQQIVGDTVAKLSRWVTITGGNNVVDAAIAKVVTGKVGTNILNIGNISGTPVQPVVRMSVEKMGCGSCLQSGQILNTFAAVNATFSCPSFSGSWINQILIALRNAGGDSGSLVVALGSCPQPVGLAFASTPDGSETYTNPIATVLSDLNVSMVGSCTSAAETDTAGTLTAGNLDAPDSQATTEEAAAGEVVNKYWPGLSKIPGVFEVGVGRDENYNVVIDVRVDAMTSEIQSQVPTRLDSYPVRILVDQRPAGSAYPGRFKMRGTSF